MPDYKKMYLALFNNVTDTIEMLQKAQQETEEMFIEDDENTEEPDDMRLQSTSPHATM